MRDIFNFSFGDFSTEVLFLSKEELLPEDGSIIVCDTNTKDLFENPGSAHQIILEPGEPAKNWDSVDSILQTALKNQLARDSRIVGVGGGVITDMTAFAASLYMRGCKVTLVPTTLLAMVDASLGGKTGIDYGGYKNMVGSFYPADQLRIVIDTLDSLPEKEYLCGLAEVIKTALLGDSELFELLRDHKDKVLNRDKEMVYEMVKRSIKVKGSVVEEDLKEKGKRAFLNLGHTFGHALESVSNFSDWSHGEAVAWGMAKAVKLGETLGLTDKKYAQAVRDMLEDYGYKLDSDASPEDLLGAMRHDKKKKGGQLRFIVQRNFEDTEIITADDKIILDILK